VAIDARPTAFLAITGQFELETLNAALRFTAVVRAASGAAEEHPDVRACATLAARAFGGDAAAWAPLVAAVRDLLTLPGVPGVGARRSRRELRAFVAENADLL
jgi:hypothetical protein